MAKKSFISADATEAVITNNIKELLREETRNRIPSMFTESYMLAEADAEDGVAEGKVINDLDVTSFATIKEVFVTSIVSVDNGKAIRVNGEIEIPLESGRKVSLFETLFTDKNEAIAKWEEYMEQKLKVALDKQNAYNNLVGFLKNQISERNF